MSILELEIAEKFSLSANLSNKKSSHHHFAQSQASTACAFAQKLCQKKLRNPLSHSYMSLVSSGIKFVGSTGRSSHNSFLGLLSPWSAKGLMTIP